MAKQSQSDATGQEVGSESVGPHTRTGEVARTECPRGHKTIRWATRKKHYYCRCCFDDEEVETWTYDRSEVVRVRPDSDPEPNMGHRWTPDYE